MLQAKNGIQHIAVGLDNNEKKKDANLLASKLAT